MDYWSKDYWSKVVAFPSHGIFSSGLDVFLEDVSSSYWATYNENKMKGRFVIGQEVSFA